MASGGPDNQTSPFDATTKVLTVSTDAGGKIAIDLAGGADAGVYTYTPPIDITTLTEFFTYNLIDGDGDTAGNTLTITIDSANSTDGRARRLCGHQPVVNYHP